MNSQKRSYEQRQVSKQFFMKATIIIVSIAMLLGIAGTAGLSALTGH